MLLILPWYLLSGSMIYNWYNSLFWININKSIEDFVFGWWCWPNEFILVQTQRTNDRVQNYKKQQMLCFFLTFTQILPILMEFSDTLQIIGIHFSSNKRSFMLFFHLMPFLKKKRHKSMNLIKILLITFNRTILHIDFRINWLRKNRKKGKVLALTDMFSMWMSAFCRNKQIKKLLIIMYFAQFYLLEIDQQQNTK